MAKITYQDKVVGATFTPDDANAIKAGINDLYDTKVDIQPGKDLSTNDFTTELLNKLNSLNTLFLGKFASLAALQAAFPTASQGQYAEVSTGGTITQYLWDDTTHWTVSMGGGVISNTDELPEGATNLYFNQNRVLDSIIGDLNGLLSNLAITSNDTLKQAIGKIIGQINFMNIALNGMVYHFRDIELVNGEKIIDHRLGTFTPTVEIWADNVWQGDVNIKRECYDNGLGASNSIKITDQTGAINFLVKIRP